MNESVFKLDDSKVIARYQRMLSEAHDREARYAALADTLANQVAMLQEELRRCREDSAVTPDGTVEPSTS